MTSWRVRGIKSGWDDERIAEAFSGAKIGEESLRGCRIPTSGFYNYPLTSDQISERIRAGEDLSLMVEDRREGVLAYLLAYSLGAINSLGLACEENPGSVLRKLSLGNRAAVYVDQLWLKPRLPLEVAARLTDAWDFLMHREKVPGVVCAIPQKPWTNVASTRIAVARGFRRCGKVNEEGVELGMFVKPYWEWDLVFDPKEDFLYVNF